MTFNSIVINNNTNNTLNILSWNVQGLLNKCDEIESLIDLFRINVICITEHWLSLFEFCDNFMPGFCIADIYCRTAHKRGGAAIFVSKSLQCIP